MERDRSSKGAFSPSCSIGAILVVIRVRLWTARIRDRATAHSNSFPSHCFFHTLGLFPSSCCSPVACNHLAQPKSPSSPPGRDLWPWRSSQRPRVSDARQVTYHRSGRSLPIRSRHQCRCQQQQHQSWCRSSAGTSVERPDPRGTRQGKRTLE